MAKKVLVITDAQNEFITGALGNKECEAAVKKYHCCSRKRGIL